MEAQKVIIPTSDASVSGLFLRPSEAKALFLFAHGAGVGMAHPGMEANATGLADRGIATLRYQFPYMERGGGRPDPPRIAHLTVRAAAASAAKLAGDLPLFAGGRSYGGRMTSQAQALAPIAGVRGLVFLGFPLHPAGAPATERADHLANIEVPMLFVSGERDALAEMRLLRAAVQSLGDRAELFVIRDGDHGLRVPARSGRTSADAQAEALDCVAGWIEERLR
ncbi:MAG TPA: alpha/beta family hydrolase [Sphingomicrobium sp.]|nr:alpha/beta family hydrolase [Sphingomicrobium sp.]